MSDSNDSDDLDWDPDRERALRKIDRAARERLTPQGPRKSIKERKAEYAQWKASRDLVAQASTVSLMARLGAEAAARRHEEEQERQREQEWSDRDVGEGEYSESDWSEEEEPSGANANYDVVMVGADPAGLLLALDLGRERLRVLLVEPSTEEPAASYIGAAHLNCATMEAFRRRGLLASVLRWGVPAWRGRGAVEISGDSAASGSVSHDAPAMSRQDAQAYGIDAAAEARTGGAAAASSQPHVLPQASQRRVLWEALAECPTVHVLRGWRVAHSSGRLDLT